MDLRSLRYAVTLAEELHFGRAAARHYIAAQAFGRQIRRLERDLGTTLFHRTSRRVELTGAGEQVIMRVRRLLADLDRLASEAAEGDPGTDAPLRVGVLGFGAAERWAELRSAVACRLPGVELEFVDLDLESQYEAVRTRQVDVALVQDVGPVDGLDFAALFSAPRVAVVPARSALASARLLRSVDLADLEPVRLAGRHPGFAEWVGPLGEARRRSPYVRHPAAIIPAVATTGSVALHGEPAQRYYPHPDVRFVPVDGPPCRVAVACRTGDTRPGVQAFRHAAGLVARMANLADRNRSGT
jgi:DNA-binding transcriptional LysR family regulator